MPHFNKYHPIRYGVMANISRSHNLREQLVPRSSGFDSLYRSLFLPRGPLLYAAFVNVFMASAMKSLWVETALDCVLRAGCGITFLGDRQSLAVPMSVKKGTHLSHGSMAKIVPILRLRARKVKEREGSHLCRLLISPHDTHISASALCLSRYLLSFTVLIRVTKALRPILTKPLFSLALAVLITHKTNSQLPGFFNSPLHMALTHVSSPPSSLEPLLPNTLAPLSSRPNMRVPTYHLAHTTDATTTTNTRQK
ncbi:hypothetical protein B0J13DRAFT_56299 [Dactylonectria estremocensis]|uniref:Uncharacterized protein n=1 Tax=Dactylonectria estremocensis TaxID=1079267 RepID=A0A9P9IZ77_9HYPO|nr:hypothetical protein B0J13DRAFT_56299 [Dactylonectria estremocensis]